MNKLANVWANLKELNLFIGIRLAFHAVVVIGLISLYLIIIPICFVLVFPFISMKDWDEPSEVFESEGRLKFAWYPVFKNMIGGDFEFYFLTWVRQHHCSGTFPFSRYTKAEKPRK